MKRYPIDIADDDITTNPPIEVTIASEIRALARRPYAVIVTFEDDSGWVGRVPDLPGVVAVGDTPDEMMRTLEDVKEVYIASLLLHGHPIPDPRPYESVVNLRSRVAAR